MNRLTAFFIAVTVVSIACSTTSTVPASQPQVVPSGSVLFQDDFSNPATGWDRLMAPQGEGVMDYDSGGYRMLVNQLQTNFWSTPHKDFPNVRIEVDSGKLGGPDNNRIGIVCRYSDAGHYFFLATSDGYYGIGLFAGGQAVLLGQSQMQYSPMIKTGVAVNHLRADCVGTTLTFFVNGTQVAQVQDGTLSTGDVGLLAGTFDTPGVDVIFDNFVVLMP